MPGAYSLDYRLESFETLSGGPVSFECKICNQLLHKPVKGCSKKHHFCSSCVENFTSCPDCSKTAHFSPAADWVYDFLDDIHVYCINKENGCKWTGERKNVETHFLNQCAHFFCDFQQQGCDWTGTDHERKIHIEKSCGFVSIRCPFGCKKAILRKNQELHELECEIFLQRKEEEAKKKQAEIKKKLEQEEKERKEQEKLRETKKQEKLKKTAAGLLQILNPPNQIRLSVGGVSFTTSEQILLTKISSTYFKAILDKCSASQQDVIFLDRDAKVFELLLNYFRCGSCFPVHLTPQELNKLFAEALFWNVNTLLKEIVTFRAADESYIEIYGADLTSRDFSDVELGRIHFVRCNLASVKFDGGNLSNTKFSECNLE